MRVAYFSLRTIIGLALICAASACATSTGSPAKPSIAVPKEATKTSIERSDTATDTQPTFTIPPATTTSLPPTATLALPTSTSTIAASSTPAEMEVKIFLIAMDDGGKSGPAVGCGDSAVGVTVRVPHSTGVLRAALTALLANHNQFYGESGLYNALYQSRLSIEDVALDAGTATIRLSGALTMGGECDSPRVEAQLKQTALQFSTVHAVTIFINGHPLSELLSGR